jgi:FKBP-type peptidyl-prolyl cis-trans isomerase FkpA
MKHAGLLATGAALALLGAACNSAAPEPEATPAVSVSATPEPPDLIKEDVKVGDGREAKKGDKVKVNYSGRLLRTNFEFDSNKGKPPVEFTIGEGMIDGWSQGLPGMKKGGKRKLTIPSRLAYAEAGHPPKIPGNAPLVFEVELVSFSDDDAAAASASASAAASASAGPATSASAGAAAGSSRPAAGPPGKKDEKKDPKP